MLFQVLGLWLHLNEIFLGLGLAVTEIISQELENIKNVKRCGMACQKVYKKGRDDSIKVNVSIKVMPHPCIFYTLQLDSMLEN